jgi:hypothetical protein
VTSAELLIGGESEVDEVEGGVRESSERDFELV